MAAIVESTAFVSAKARMALSAEITRSAAVTSVSVRGKAGLCRFGALKVQQQPKRHLGLVAFDSKTDSAVVSEAQETALDVPSVTDLTWQSLVLKADGPVLVMFSAPWCGPCRVINPVIGELAKQYDGKLSCFKLNTDSSPSVATKHGVRSIPTIMIFNKGEKKESVIGAVSKSSLENTIEKFL